MLKELRNIKWPSFGKIVEVLRSSWKAVIDYFRIPEGVPLLVRGAVVTAYVFAFFLLFILLVDINFLGLFGKSPVIRELKNPPMSITSELISADGKLLARYYTEDRTPVEYKDLPQNLIDALIATEDVRFYKHHGIDFKATFAALWSTLRGDRRGGSTITQQLVKNLFKTRSDYSTGIVGKIPGLSTLNYKMKEWINALKIESYYSKEDIITMYFNTVDFGSKAFGINSASSMFFNCHPIDLKPHQSALLVGILKAPSYYSPVSHPKKAFTRRNQVFVQLERYGYISSAEKDSLSDLPLGVKFDRRNKKSDGASYLRDAVARSLQQWSRESGYDIWTDGLKIYTSIDSHMQEYAEKSVGEHLRRLQQVFNRGGSSVVVPWIDENGKEDFGYFLNLTDDVPAIKNAVIRWGNNADSLKYHLTKRHKMEVFTWNGVRDTTLSTIDSIKHYKRFFQCGFIAMEPATGLVKAWVGGINYAYFKYDHVNQSKRQPGSLFKGFVYSAAFDNGFGPCDHLTDQPVSIKYVEKGVNKEWKPRNVDRSHSGSMTLKHAFARSVNSIAVQITQKIGWKKIIERAHALGIQSELADVPSVCLGSSDVSLAEIVAAYCGFINDGYRVDPVLVTRIEDKDGNVLYEAKSEKKRVISSENAFLMTTILRAGLTEPGGTPQGLFEHDIFRFDTDFGGKTGTSNDYADGWFIGVTPGLVGGCWVGNDDRSIHFRTSHVGEGLRTAMPVYGKFMEKVLKDEKMKRYRQRFGKPAVTISKSYDCHTVLPKADSLRLANDSIIE
ncbi:MAG TPA: transglycosylase domain-containing protein [Bacteroidales bacterium]|nr:transglycosylase domain-containing protein [Bacteroidales bacterium]HPT03095.1 transglycosylase domain-containing protein [Bacteroidales bacterium]